MSSCPLCKNNENNIKLFNRKYYISSGKLSDSAYNGGDNRYNSNSMSRMWIYL